MMEIKVFGIHIDTFGVIVILLFSVYFYFAHFTKLNNKDVAVTEVEEGMEPLFVEMDVSAYCKNSCCTERFSDGITASVVSAVG